MNLNFTTSIMVLILLLWNTVSAVEEPGKDKEQGSAKVELLNFLEAEGYTLSLIHI